MPKRKTKKQKEEEKRKAEEERLRLEEEQRIRDEEERKKREEEERIRKELEEKLRQEELARLQEEQSKVIERSNAISRLTVESEERKEEGDEWAKHIACDPLPDPENERELSSFLTLWEESKDKNLNECINNCKTAELVIHKLLTLHFDAMAEFRTENIIW